MLTRVRVWLARWLRWVAEWLNPTPVLSAPTPAWQTRAAELVAQMETGCAPGTSGEYKRHVVYSRLLKEFPTVEKRALSRAIEGALR